MRLRLHLTTSLVLLSAACASPAPPPAKTTPPAQPSQADKAACIPASVKTVRHQRAQVVLPGAFTVAQDTSGVQARVGEGSRCGPSTVELSLIALPEPPQATASSTEGMRCQTHTVMAHKRISGDLYARLICKERGEFDGLSPTLCDPVARSLSVLDKANAPTQTLEAGLWELRPARVPLKGSPNAVEYYMPGAAFWQVSLSRRTLELDTSSSVDVIVGDRARSGDQTLLVRRDATGAHLIFDAYVEALKPAPGTLSTTPLDLYVTVRLDAQPPAPQLACTIWRFDGGRYKDTGRACP